jgi:hypothetical protein
MKHMRSIFTLSLTALSLLVAMRADAQQYMTRTAHVDFFSSTPAEDISAATEQASAVMDLATQSIAFQVPIISFHFEKALMEEHFNENYLESEQYPSATFQGLLSGLNPDAAMGESQQVTATGTLTIHGVSVEREVAGAAVRTESGWQLEARFEVPTEDHQIPIPKLVRSKIAESISITLRAELNPR